MKTKNPIKILFNPYFISLIITVIIIFFLPDLFSKYRVEVVEEGKLAYRDEAVYFDDLNNDGNSEKIRAFHTIQNRYAIQVFDHQEATIDQWNLNGIKAGKEPGILIGDYNSDGLKEIFTFCDLNDSVFLYVVNPVENGGFMTEHSFITYLDPLDENLEYTISGLKLKDLDRDSIKELVFFISGNQSTLTRNVFIYNLKNDSLLSSPKSATVIYDIQFTDLTKDGIPELTGSTYACGNYFDTTAPLNDYSSWLMVYNADFELIFKPVEYKGFHTKILAIPFEYKDASSILSLYNSTGSDTCKPHLFLTDSNGDIIYRKQFPDTLKRSRYFYNEKHNNGRILVFSENGSIYRIDKNVNVKHIRETGFRIKTRPLAVFDADDDGLVEYFFRLANKHQIAILRHDFSNPVFIDLQEERKHGLPFIISGISKKGKKSKLFIQYEDSYTTYIYGYNYLYILRYPIYLGIYLLILLFIVLIRKLQQLQIREKLELQNSISELQLKTINNQLNPHFTFNTFNSIASLLKKEKGETAYNYFLKFSNLIRSNLLSADHISRTINEELETIRNYLEIQQLRFEKRFEYHINIDNQIDGNTIIPKMILQNYIENAVNHGLKHLKEGGKLLVHVSKKEKQLLFSIEDNGIGRKKASEMDSYSTGKGLLIMDQYFDLLNKYNDIKINQEIIDLYDDEGKPAGTKVLLTLPEKINFNIYREIR